MELGRGELIAIARGVKSEQIAFVGQALLDAGFSYIEVSLSEPEEGLACIKELKAKFGSSLILGAGTVTTHELMQRAVEAGAVYIITPAWDARLVREAMAEKLPVFPGVFSPSEVLEALQMGLRQLKLFPIVNLGAGYVKNLHGPFPQAEFIGVGGITLQNIRGFWNAGCHGFALGSDLIPRNAGKSDADGITKKAREYLKAFDD